MTLQSLLIYLGIINIVTLLVYGTDKLKAKSNQWRTPETTLIILAALGGSIGAWIAMILFRHKTKHIKFTWGIPTIFILQIIAACILLFYGCKSIPITENKTEQVGGYIQPRSITEEEFELFKKTTSGTVYEKYKPESVSTQIVAGVNFRYICSNGKIITIHKPLPNQGEPRILEVK